MIFFVPHAIFYMKQPLCLYNPSLKWQKCKKVILFENKEELLEANNTENSDNAISGYSYNIFEKAHRYRDREWKMESGKWLQYQTQ